jgi:hypothetical protein
VIAARLDSVITGHPAWAEFGEEEAKTNRLLAKAQARAAKEAAARKEHEQRHARFEADRLAADLEDREPDSSIKYPGEYVAPEPFFGRRQPIEVVHERIGLLEEARRSWAKRMAGELVPELVAKDAAEVAELRARIQGLTDALEDLDRVRGSLAWITACGGVAPQAPNLHEVQELSAQLAHAINRLGFASEASTAPTDGIARLPMNLDGLSVE